MHSIPILVLLFMTLAFPAWAGDGVLEINQTCAVQTSCFAGGYGGASGHNQRQRQLPADEQLRRLE
jgi:hypothetical protein